MWSPPQTQRKAKGKKCSRSVSFAQFAFCICYFSILRFVEYQCCRPHGRRLNKTPPLPKPSSSDVYQCLSDDNGDELSVAEKELPAAKRKYEQMRYHYDRAVKARTAKPMPTQTDSPSGVPPPLPSLPFLPPCQYWCLRCLLFVLFGLHVICCFVFLL